MYRGNLRNTGVYATSAARTFWENPNWVFRAESAFHTSPLVADDQVYFGTSEGVLFSLDAETGSERWRFEAGAPILDGFSVFGETIYCSTSNGLLAVDIRTGNAVDLIGAFTNLEGPVQHAIFDGVMYVAGGEYYGALDLFTGREKWFQRRGEYFMKRPAIGDGIVCFVSFTGLFDIINMNTGTSIWQDCLTGEGWIPDDIVLHDHVIYLFSTEAAPWDETDDSAPGHLMKMDIRNRRFGSYSGIPDDMAASPALHEGTLYYGCVSGALYALNLENVNFRLRFRAEAPARSAPSIAQDLIYFGADDGCLYVVKKDTGELLKKLQTESGQPIRTAPVIKDSVVYFGDQGGTLYSWGTNPINQITEL